MDELFLILVVRSERFELSRITPLPPEDSASASSATTAYQIFSTYLFYYFCDTFASVVFGFLQIFLRPCPFGFESPRLYAQNKTGAHRTPALFWCGQRDFKAALRASSVLRLPFRSPWTTACSNAHWAFSLTAVPFRVRIPSFICTKQNRRPSDACLVLVRSKGFEPPWSPTRT